MCEAEREQNALLAQGWVPLRVNPNESQPLRENLGLAVARLKVKTRIGHVVKWPRSKARTVYIQAEWLDCLCRWQKRRALPRTKAEADRQRVTDALQRPLAKHLDDLVLDSAPEPEFYRMLLQMPDRYVGWQRPDPDYYRRRIRFL